MASPLVSTCSLAEPCQILNQCHFSLNGRKSPAFVQSDNRQRKDEGVTLQRPRLGMRCGHGVQGLQMELGVGLSQVLMPGYLLGS